MLTTTRPTLSRRLAATVLAGALLAAACGSDDPNTSAEADPPTTDSVESTEPNSTDDSGNATDDNDSEGGEPAAAADETVTVTDATGEVTMPVTDEGVYVLDGLAGIALLSLGIETLGIAELFQDPTVNRVFESLEIALDPSSNLETVAATDPSIILGIGHPNHLELKAEYDAIAPSAYPDFTTPWQDQTRVFAAITGREDRAEVVISTIDERVDALRARIDEAGLAGQQVSIIQPFGAEFYAYGPTTLAGDIVDRLGFPRSDVQSADGDFGFIEIAEELLPEQVDADVVVSITGTDGGASLFENPVVDVGDAASGDVTPIWTANHALAAWVILDDIESLLFGDGATVSADALPDVWQELLAEIDRDSADAADAEASPVRVVDLSDFLFDLAALDNAPVANIYGSDFLGPVLDRSLLTDQQRAAILAGDNAAPAFELNVEAVLALDPDLVVTSPSLLAFYPAIDDLRGATEVLVIDDDIDWRERSRATAAAIGRPDAFEERIADVEASIDQLAVRVESLGLVGTEVSLLRAFQGEVTAFNPPSIASTIIAEAGLTQPAAQLVDQPDDSIQPDYAAQTVLSSELLGDHQADYAIIANTLDLSSATAELPPDLPIDLIPVLGEDGTNLVTSYFFFGLNSVVGVETIVRDINLLLDKIEAG
ncbi:MAG: ABC transporter substrate-binding protein [Actinomycetota bacterium]